MARKYIVALIILLAAWPAWGQESRPGVGVDARGGAVIDPTKNVLDLVEAAIRRQDDLRGAAERLFDAKLQAAEKISEIRYIHSIENAKALAEQLNAEARLRADYDEKLRTAEAKRIDAIRAVDVNAVAVASTRATDQAQVLATQVNASAEALRSLVATTASTVAASQQQLANTLSARLTTLEQAGYQQAGQQKFQDPAFIALVAEVKALTASRADLAGINSGRGDVIGWFAAAFMGLIALGSLLFSMNRRTR